MTKQLGLRCPYCSTKWSIPARLGSDADVAHEVRCVPYTRDVNRFDPQSRQAAAQVDRWSSIGSDFLPALHYDQRFGILSLPEPNDQVVKYRVELCPACDAMLDVYVSCAAQPLARSLDHIWPHLFAPKGRLLKPYRRSSLPLSILRRLGHGSVTAGALVLSLLAVLQAFAPWAVGPPEETPPIPLLAALYTVCSIAIVGVSRLYDQIVRAQDNLSDLRRLLQVDTVSGVQHWQNYTLCRFVGLQPEKRPPRLSQVDAVSGGLSIGILGVTMAACGNISWTAGGLLLGELGCYVGGVLILRAGWFSEPSEQAPGVRHHRERVIAGLFLICLPLTVTIGMAVFPAFRSIAPISAMHQASNALYWLLVAYFLAVGFHLALTCIFYILRGLTRIPLRPGSAGDRWHYRPVLIFRAFAYKMLFGVFTLLITAGSLIEAFRQPAFVANWPAMQGSDSMSWLEWWFLFVIGAVLACLIIVSEPRLAFVLVPFALVAIATRESKLVLVSSPTVSVDWRVIVLAIGLAVCFIWLTRDMEASTYRLLNSARLRIVHDIDDSLGTLPRRVDFSGSARSGTPAGGTVDAADLLLRYRATILDSRWSRRWSWLGGLGLTLTGVVLQPMFELFLRGLTGS